MIRLASAALLACLFLSATAVAQTPQISDAARRAITAQPRVVIAPAARAQLASRLAGEPVTPAQITDTVSVSVLSPVVGEPGAPTLALEGRGVQWLTTGADPRAVIATFSAEVNLIMQVAPHVRHLVVCEMGSRSAVSLRSDWGGPAMSITWESDTRGAVLVPAVPEARRLILHFTGGGAVRSCEVSRIG